MGTWIYCRRKKGSAIFRSRSDVDGTASDLLHMIDPWENLSQPVHRLSVRILFRRSRESQRINVIKNRFIIPCHDVLCTPIFPCSKGFPSGEAVSRRLTDEVFLLIYLHKFYSTRYAFAPCAGRLTSSSSSALPFSPDQSSVHPCASKISSSARLILIFPSPSPALKAET